MEETVARAAQITIALLTAFSVVLWFSLVVWAYRDVVRRSESALVQIFSTVLVILGFIPGAIVYLLLRPRDLLEEQYQRSVEAAFLESELENTPACPECETYVREEYQFCPNCGLELRRACPACGRLAEIDWNVCAFCGIDMSQRASRRASRASQVDRQTVQASEWEVELGSASVTNDTGDLPAQDFDWETVTQSEHRGRGAGS